MNLPLDNQLDMQQLAEQYSAHIAELQTRAKTILQRENLDAVLIHSGEPLRIFLDDRDYPFKVNAHFKAWVPVTQVPNCWLWIDGVNKPKLWFYSPVDYWHSVEPLPTDFWTNDVDVIGLHDANGIAKMLPREREHVAYIGPVAERAKSLGFTEKNINPTSVITYFDYHRSFKTQYELLCMREAQKVAVTGHRAAYQAFLMGMSEFEINAAYLLATDHRDTDVPYDNIVALNEHASVLHYTHLDLKAPKESVSFLLDAGAEFNGYAADLTRTYAALGHDEFAAMVADMTEHQQQLISNMKVGDSYTEHHIAMHHRVAEILLKHGLLKNISETDAVEKGLTTPFLPHGLGHQLGLMVHDSAGFMQDENGTHLAAPAKYPYLRCTRKLESGMVLTIEPGLYFIESLLSPWRDGEFSQYFNWEKIEFMKQYGGIRIEDNIVVHGDRIENMTRDLGLA